jgi:NAD(P)-dependent dehydrogenase (short-subunit alcohol dehydrogenase family)
MATVLVTGASRGIGLEFVRQYAKDGAQVLASCRDPESARELQKLAASDPRIRVHRLDVTDGKNVDTLARELRGEAIDILINNAGIIGTRSGAMDYDLWEETLRVNTIAPFRIAQALRENLERGEARKIVTITSGMASTTTNSGGYYAYRSSKAAVNNVMRGLAADWSQDRFIVVVISPGWVATDMGGRGAPLSPAESVGAMRRLIAGLKRSDSGRFLDLNGRELPW